MTTHAEALAAWPTWWPRPVQPGDRNGCVLATTDQHLLLFWWPKGWWAAHDEAQTGYHDTAAGAVAELIRACPELGEPKVQP